MAEDRALKSQIVAALNIERVSLQNQIAANNANITALQSQVAESVEEISTLSREKSELQRQVRANVDKMATLRTHAAAEPRALGRRKDSTRANRQRSELRLVD